MAPARLFVAPLGVIFLAASLFAPTPLPADAAEPPLPVDQVIAALDDALQRVDDEVAVKVEAAGSVPLAGEDLSEVLAPVGDALADIRSLLATWVVPTAEAGGQSRAELFVEGALWALLGPENALDHPDLDPIVRDALRAADVPGLGLDLLVNEAGGAPGPGDVSLSVEVDPTTGALVVDLRLVIGQNSDLVVPAELDLGLSVDDAETSALIPNFGLDLRLSQGLRVELGWRAVLHVGVEIPLGSGSAATGPYLGADTGLSADATVSIAKGPGDPTGFEGRVALGLLQAELSDGVTRESGGRERSSLTVAARVGLGGASGDRIPIASLGSDSLAAELSVSAAIRLQVDASIDHLTEALNSAIEAGEFAVGVPSLNFSLIADPSFTLGADGSGRSADIGLDEIRFENLRIDMREFLRNVMVPMARNATQLTAPVNEALGLDAVNERAAEGLLNEPLPIISELSDEPVTLRTLGLDEEFTDLVEALSAITDFQAEVEAYIEGPEFVADIGNNGFIPLPCLAIVLERRSPLHIRNTRSPVPCLVRDGVTKLEDFDPMIDVSISIQPSVFSLDMITPESVYSLILGESVDIVSIGFPKVEATASASPSLDLDVISIDVKAEAHAEVGLRLVYDSAGIEALVDQLAAGDALDLSVLADGFYLETRPGACATAEELAKPLAERDLGCEVGVGAGFDGRLQLGPDEANVWGQIDVAGDLGFSVTDPDDDGELRGPELAALTNDWADPENLFCLFDLRAAGSAYLAAGVVTPLGDRTAELPNVAGDFSLLELLTTEFEICADLDPTSITPPAPVLAHTTTSAAGERLIVHTGPFAALRRMPDRVDDLGLQVDVTGTAQRVDVRVRTTVSGSEFLERLDLTQSFDGPFSEIVVPGGPADDTINVSVPVDVRIDAGRGHDTVTTGEGADDIDGGAGGDTITTNGGPDSIAGGPGSDHITSGPGADSVSGGAGSDTIDTGDDDDTVAGGGDVDVIETGSGDDRVEGGGGDDRIIGGPGDDEITGDGGDDTVVAGAGDDTVETGTGADTVFGGSGDDEIVTGPGADFVAADADDALRVCEEAPSDGAAGADSIDAGSGDDIVLPGPGDDDVEAGIGDDCVRSTEGGDRLDLSAGNDDLTVRGAEHLRSRAGRPGFLVDRGSDLVTILGTDQLALGSIDQLRIGELATPVTVEALGPKVIIGPLGADLDLLGRPLIELVPGSSVGGDVTIAPASDARLEVAGLGDGTITTDADARIVYTGGDQPDQVRVEGGAEVDVRTGSGSDRVTIVPSPPEPVRATVDAGDGQDTVVLDLGFSPFATVGTLPIDSTPFAGVEIVDVLGGINAALGWDDGVLTAGDGNTPLVNLGAAATVRLPAFLENVVVDASDDGGRSVELIDRTVVVAGARAIPPFDPVPDRDQILVWRADSSLDIYEAGPGADLIATTNIVGGLESLVAADLTGDGLDELFAFQNGLLTVYRSTPDGPQVVLPVRRPGGGLDLSSWTDATAAVDPRTGRDMVLALRSSPVAPCIVDIFYAIGAPETLSCGRVPADELSIFPTQHVLQPGQAAAFALHDRGARGLTFVVPSPDGDFTSPGVIFYGPTDLGGVWTGIACSHGHRLAGESENYLRRARLNFLDIEFRDRSKISTADIVDLVSIEPLDGTNVVAAMTNGQVHLDDDYCRQGAVFGETIDTGIRVGPGDQVIAGRFAAGASDASPPNTSVEPVIIEAPDARRFRLTTGAAVDSYVIGQTDASVDLDSGGGGDLVNLDLLADGFPQLLTVETGAGNDQVGLRVDGEPAFVGIGTGPGSDRVDLFDVPASGDVSIDGAGDGDVLRVHPEGRTVSFDTGDLPAMPDGDVTIAGDRTAAYNGIEQVLVNVGPVADLQAPTTVDEGSVVEISAAGSRSPDGRPLIFSWDLDGDGVFDDSAVAGEPPATGDEQVLFVDDDGAYRVAVRVTDDLGRSSERSATITASVVSPTVALIEAAGPAFEGHPTILALVETSNGGADTIESVLIDWGDETAPEPAAPGPIAHVYAAAGTYDVSVMEIVDDDGSHPVDDQTVQTVVRTPELSAGGPQAIDEGASYQLTLAVGDAPPVDRWEIDWGDGSAETVAGDAPSAVHVYDGSRTAAIAVTAVFTSGVERAVDGPMVAVANIVPGFTGSVPASVAEGPVSITLGADDPGDDTIVSWLVDWGDGTLDELPASAVTATHDFVPGRYPVTVVASDDDGDHLLVDQMLEVTNRPPVIGLIEVSDAVEGGATHVEVIGGDADPGNLTFTFEAPAAVEPVVMTLGPNASLMFADDGRHTLDVEVRDAFGGATSQRLEVEVANAPPSASIRLGGTRGRILEGEDVTVEIGVIDRGDDTATKAIVDWGDGSPLEDVELDAGQGTATHIYADGSATRREAIEVDGVFMIDGVEVIDESASVVEGTKQVITLIEVVDEDGTHPIGDEVDTEVVDVGPMANATIATVGAEVRLDVGVITDPGDDTITEHRIDWGDGTIETFTGSPAPGQVFTHPAGPDVGPVLLVLVDEDGSHVAATFSVADVAAEPNVVEVRARGREGDEEMVVNAGGVEETFTVGTDWATYTVDLGEVDVASLEEVEVAFVNDRFVRGVLNRTLIVDYIVVDGIRYESEDPSVFSQGTWHARFGCTGRFAGVESLSCDGHFTFVLIPQAATIEVLAKGDTGEERIVVTAAGVSAGFSLSEAYEVYTMTVPGAAELSAVEVAFVNDLYRPGEIDRNVTVDHIVVDGVIVESEDARTHSTGSWARSVACKARFARSERLHCPGSFTYDLS